MSALLELLYLLIKIYLKYCYESAIQICQLKRTSTTWTSVWPNILICFLMSLVMWGTLQKILYFLNLLWKLLLLLIRLAKFLLRIWKS
ncbi:TPA_asm: P overlapped [Pinellia alphacytorhabdovirus 1]|nr:TPA_asm: P overlapped [Pinellia alphacytorhabdovirus 1]